MKKLNLLVLGFAVFALAACGGGNGSSGDTRSQSQSSTESGGSSSSQSETYSSELADHLPENLKFKFDLGIGFEVEVYKIGDNYLDATLKEYYKKESNGSYTAYAYDSFEGEWAEEKTNIKGEDKVLATGCLGVDFILSKWDKSSYVSVAAFNLAGYRMLAGCLCSNYTYEVAGFTFNYYINDDGFTFEYEIVGLSDFKVLEWDTSVTSFPMEVVA